MDISLGCECGKVTGVAKNATPSSGTRLNCYCNDCQAFLRHLGKAETVLDPWGGTDIFQMAQAHVKIYTGADQVRCLRLTDKGLHRWYTACCNTPIGNTLGSGMPFIGIIHAFISQPGERDVLLGPSRGNVWIKDASIDALGDAPESLRKGGNPYLLLLRSIRKLIVWKLKGLDQPSPFFDNSGKPVSEPEILLS
jgi:hypothetical protein